MAAQLHSRTRAGTEIHGVPAIAETGAVFNSVTGDTATAAVSAADVTTLMARFPDVHEVGVPGIQLFEDVSGNVVTVIVVPSGKFWRLIGFSMEYVADANAATRVVLVQPRIADDTAITGSLITMGDITANDTDRLTALFGAVNVGDTNDVSSTLDGHTHGVLLVPTDEISITITNGLAGDDIDFYLFYLEYDNDPRT